MCASDCKLIMKHMGTPQIYDLETPDLTFKFFIAKQIKFVLNIEDHAYIFTYINAVSALVCIFVSFL